MFNQIQWKNRRRYVIWVTTFIMCFMVYMVERIGDAAITSTTISMGMTMLFGITGSYVFGAVWDHKNARTANVAGSTKTHSGSTVSRVMDQG